MSRRRITPEDLADLDYLRLRAGLSVSGEGFALDLLRVPPREPRSTWLVYGEDGQPIAHGDERMRDRHAATHRVEERKPTRYATAKYRKEKAAWDRLVALWEEWDAMKVRGYRRLSHLSRTRNADLMRAVGEAVGADLWRDLPRGDVVEYAKGFGGRGFELSGPRGRVFLDAAVEGDRPPAVYLAQIAVEHKGEGLGTAAMEAIRAHAAERGYGIVVYKVTNRAWFRGLGWLEEREGGMEFRAAPPPIPSPGR